MESGKYQNNNNNKIMDAFFESFFREEWNLRGWKYAGCRGLRKYVNDYFHGDMSGFLKEHYREHFSAEEKAYFLILMDLDECLCGMCQFVLSADFH